MGLTARAAVAKRHSKTPFEVEFRHRWREGYRIRFTVLAEQTEQAERQASDDLGYFYGEVAGDFFAPLLSEPAREPLKTVPSAR